MKIEEEKRDAREPTGSNTGKEVTRKKKRDGKGPGNSELSRNSLVILTSARCIREM